jgi:hypothetical protein
MGSLLKDMKKATKQEIAASDQTWMILILKFTPLLTMKSSFTDI